MKLLIILGVYFLISVNALQVNDSCTTACGKPGQCVPWNSCRYFRNKLRRDDDASNVASYLEKSKCGDSQSETLLTCCPRPFNPEDCGIVNTTTYNHAGEPDLYVTPWNGLLVYRTVGNNVRVPVCAATLITSRFMLTSARCSRDPHNTWILTKVRFEWDRRIRPAVPIFNDFWLQEYNIEQIFLHPKYLTKTVPDIAVLKLRLEVPFNMYVRPICLPLGDTIQNMPDYGSYLTVAGWPQSLTHGEMKILRDPHRMYDNSEYCKEFDQEFNYGGSGGALVRKVNSVWYQVGVVGFETNDCDVGSDMKQEVHTPVVKYLGWIEDVVNESHCW